MAKRINELAPNVLVEDTDTLATGKGAIDVKTTVSQLKAKILDSIEDQDIMDAVQRLDGDSSGLNANFLQGLAAAHFLNASNLNDGIISRDRLPQGELRLASSAIAGNPYTDDDARPRWYQFRFEFAGRRIQIEAGVGQFMRADRSASINFLTPFVSGLFGTGRPLVFISPECREDGLDWYNNNAGTPDFNVEIDVRLYRKSLNNFTYGSIRTKGTNNDYVRPVWIAIGEY